MTNIIRIAGIDHSTGYVWGETENLPSHMSDEATLQHAAAQIMRAADGSRHYDPSEFQECSRRDAAATLHLFEIAGDVEIHDGQDQGTIGAVEAGRYLGSVRYVPAEG